MLGMIIGVGAVITMVALGTGAQGTIDAQIRSVGTNMVIVTAGNFTQGGVRQGQGNASTLVPEDATAISQLPGVQYTAAGANTRGQIVAGNQNWNTQVQGTDVDFPQIRSWPTTTGAFFTPQDVATAAKVAVIGNTVRDQLFGPDTDPTGQIIRISSGGNGTAVQNQPFTVVGVMGVKGQSGVGQDQDDVIYVPYTTVMKKLCGVDQRSAGHGVSGVGRRDHPRGRRHRHSSAGAPQDPARGSRRLPLWVRTMDEIASVREQTTQTMTALLASIAGVSLVVGGIGIMNIMLVSVTERTREIGLRMAIGAKGRDVLLQFLVEAVVLSAFGGSIGIALGFALSKGLTIWMQWPTQVSPRTR